jgi:hypothetical protein
MRGSPVRRTLRAMEGEDAALRRLLEDRLYVACAVAGVISLLAAVAWLDLRLLLAFPLSVLAFRWLYRRGTLERFPERRRDELPY